MSSNQHLLLHGLRMLVLAIVLVLAPANTEAYEYSAAETPVLVLSLARDLSATTPRCASSGVGFSEALRAAQAATESTGWAGGTTSLGRLVDAEPRVVRRELYLVDCSWLC